MPKPPPLRWSNPVWPGYFADPFVLSWRDEYFAFGTEGRIEQTPDGDGRVFKILRSRDLATWHEAGAAFCVSPAKATWDYWAPEVAEERGSFFLYYSCAPRGDDSNQRLRVAVAGHPTGPYVDGGNVLPESEGFCIDAHPFRDPKDGRWYLFFARDYFDGRAGTGLAVVPLARDMLRGEGASQPVWRATADWQIYERNRRHYGKSWTAWHTVEGPCVVEQAGRYYCFFSGGNWQTLDYGVSYAVADHPLGPWTAAPESGPIVLRQKQNAVLGPGHNSYVRAPNGREMLVYHAWDPERTARRMCIDPLEWTSHGPRCLGPTIGAQSLA